MLGADYIDLYLRDARLTFNVMKTKDSFSGQLNDKKWTVHGSRKEEDFPDQFSGQRISSLVNGSRMNKTISGHQIKNE